MQHPRVVTGTLSDDRTVRLDEPVSLESTRVRVTIEPLPVGSQRTYLEVVAEIRQRQLTRGHRPPTRDEVDKRVSSERKSRDG